VLENGECPKGKKDLLQGEEVQKAYMAQSNPVQGWKSIQFRTGNEVFMEIESI